MTTIRRYGNITEAGFAQSLLAAAGIDATIADEYAGTLGPQFVPWGMRLQVPEADVERALQILDGERGLESDTPDPVPETPPAAEHEVAPRDDPETETPSLICPGCGAGWVLTAEELAQPSFTCSDCGALIPLEKAEAPSKGSRKFDWHFFLPRSDSKWVFAVVMVAYNHAVETLWSSLTYSFVPYRETHYVAYGWPYVLSRVGHALVFYPVLETILLVGIIELLQAARAPAMVQVFVAVLAPCAVDGFRWWPHGLAVAPGFTLMAFAYLYWRPKSRWDGFVIVVAIHALYNATLYTRLVLDQVHSEIVSWQRTGNPFNWDRAESLYSKGRPLADTGQPGKEINLLEQANALYPYDPNIFLSLGLAYREAGRLSDAEAAIRKAIALDQSRWPAWDDLSFVLYDEKRFSEAMEAAHCALVAAPAANQAEVKAMIAYIAPKLSGTAR